MKEQTRLTIPVYGNIIFGYPPTLPQPEEVILITLTPQIKTVHTYTKIRKSLINTFSQIQKKVSLRRTGTRSSSKV